MALSVGLTGLVLLTGTAFANSPHFVNSSDSIDNAGALVISFKEAGLGTNQLISYEGSADATAVYACINGGGKHPQATNKETVNGPVSGTGAFSSGKNGQVTGSLTLEPPSAGSFSCPNGQHLVLASVSYTNILLQDTTNGIDAPIAGTISKTFFNV